MIVRDVTEQDLPDLLAINQSHLDAVGSVDLERLRWIVGLADRALIADDDGAIAGFVVTVPPGTAYDSVNYAWFEEHHAFGRYLDRVIVSPTHRRQGVGSLLYDAVEDVRPVALEVYTTNDASLAFHASRGYEVVGEIPQDHGKTCSAFLLR